MTLINYLPSVLSGRNSEVFPNILRFYLPRGGLVCDLNYGRGKFYQSLEEDNLMIIGCDILPSLPVDLVADCRNPPFRNQVFDAIVMDPPYQHIGKKRWLTNGSGIFQKDYSKIPDQAHMMTLFNDSELSRILKDDGILIIKIMDMIESSKPVWNHMLLPQKLKSFDLEDLLIYSFRGVYDPKWGRMMHSRKCHAYFMIFKKAGTKWAKRFEGFR